MTSLQGTAATRSGRTGPRFFAPAGLCDAVSLFERRMRTLEANCANGACERTEAQSRANAACTAVVESFRRYVHQDPAREDGLGAYLFRETYPYFSASRLIDRSYRKPRGYAGDYLTIDMVYDDEPGGEGRLGPLIDRWFLDIPASRAVKNRRPLLAGIIGDLAAEQGPTPLRVTSLASGPARELLDALGTEDAVRLLATCLDIDADALLYAHAAAERAGVADQFRFVHANVVKLALGRDTIALDDQDLIYSVGLIDYLRDDLVVALLDWIHERLRPGGTVLVGNFDPANPSKPFMDHILDWKLIHRTADDLRALFERSRFADSPVHIRTEATGINLFARARRS